MVRDPEETLAGSPVLYAGRFSDRVRAALPGESPVLSDWDVLPAQLSAALQEASALVVLDPLSFPYETMPAEGWNLPLVLFLPPEHDAGFVQDILDEPVLRRMGFFDRLVVRDDDLWEALRSRHRWSGCQRLPVGGETPEEAAAEILARLETGAPPAEVVPCPSVRSLHLDKAVHRAQSGALNPQFVAARGEVAEDAPLDVLEVGAGDGRWAASFDPAATRFCGVDFEEGRVSAARANFPDRRFDLAGPDLLLPHEDESFDLVFCVDTLNRHPAPARRTLLSEMWRVARVGGRLVFLEDFVAGRRIGGSAARPMSVLRFVDLLLEATNGQVVLEHVQSLRYPRDDVVRGGVISVSRLGVPTKW